MGNSYHCSLSLTPTIVSYTMHIMLLSVLQCSDIQYNCISQYNCNINNMIVYIVYDTIVGVKLRLQW